MKRKDGSKMYREEMSLEERRIDDHFFKIEKSLTRQFIEMTQRDGVPVCVGVMCNLISTLMARTILIVEEGGGNPNELIDQIMENARESCADAKKIIGRSGSLN